MFDAQEAMKIGLLSEVVADTDALNKMEVSLRKSIAANSPDAVTAAKDLIAAVSGKPITDDLIDDTAQRLADVRASPQV